ncbi:hypothetical protein SAMN02745163_01986 [Clostridium cavendishii DSM 21758]|uniref:Transposase n=1 Tax=Clostridium cavendishii DSM 21758 TaxID=1121302 RepID=A0A1M6JCM8_9CLOT|nr:hypothetical protein [Clostridium cavendishii]SHJ44370.1 hypothetical protein SAMN02745163_01986 [Clostridium cavendishii DSM 21758]
MTKTLYDPEVEIKGEIKGELKKAKTTIKNMLLKGMDIETIAELVEVDIELVKEVEKNLSKNN